MWTFILFQGTADVTAATYRNQELRREEPAAVHTCCRKPAGIQLILTEPLLTAELTFNRTGNDGVMRQSERERRGSIGEGERKQRM